MLGHIHFISATLPSLINYVVQKYEYTCFCTLWYSDSGRRIPRAGGQGDYATVTIRTSVYVCGYCSGEGDESNKAG
jgi:hypothetical protein